MTSPELEGSDPSYDLFVREGRGGFVLFFKDQGITLGADQLSYPVNGRTISRPYDSIHTVKLSLASAGRSRPLAQCVIEFRGDVPLMISTASATGFPERQREAPFRDFVVDLHRRLVDTGAMRRISFQRGMSQGRHTVLMVALVAMALLFIGLPLVLALIVHELKVLLVLIAGVTFVLPFWKIVEKNQPGTYNPAHPPDLLS